MTLPQTVRIREIQDETRTIRTFVLEATAPFGRSTSSFVYHSRAGAARCLPRPVDTPQPLRRTSGM